jgi:polyhydroxyalkanoate synthesis regulator protein
MENFAANQEQIRRYIESTFGQFFPLSQFEDMARQNLALFQRAATMFQPPQAAGNAAEPESPAASAPDTSHEIKALNQKIEGLQEQIGRLVEAQDRKS